MAEIKLKNVEIHHKYAEASHWDTYADNIPAKGDFVSFEVPFTDGSKTILLKQGDGTTALKDLPFISGLSADVYDWAKQATPDATLSDTSENAVQNKAVKNYVDTEISNATAEFSIEEVEDDLIISEEDIKSLSILPDLVDLTNN